MAIHREIIDQISLLSKNSVDDTQNEEAPSCSALSQKDGNFEILENLDTEASKYRKNDTQELYASAIFPKYVLLSYNFKYEFDI